MPEDNMPCEVCGAAPAYWNQYAGVKVAEFGGPWSAFTPPPSGFGHADESPMGWFCVDHFPGGVEGITSQYA